MDLVGTAERHALKDASGHVLRSVRNEHSARRRVERESRRAHGTQSARGEARSRLKLLTDASAANMTRSLVQSHSDAPEDAAELYAGARGASPDGGAQFVQASAQIGEAREQVRDAFGHNGELGEGAEREDESRESVSRHLRGSFTLRQVNVCIRMLSQTAESKQYKFI